VPTKPPPASDDTLAPMIARLARDDIDATLAAFSRDDDRLAETLTRLAGDPLDATLAELARDDVDLGSLLVEPPGPTLRSIPPARA
jgi:hypothetical protein